MQSTTKAFARSPGKLATRTLSASSPLGDLALDAIDRYEEAWHRQREFNRALGRAGTDPGPEIRDLERLSNLARNERSNAEEALVGVIVAADPDVLPIALADVSRHHWRPRGIVRGDRLYLIVPANPMEDPAFHEDGKGSAKAWATVPLVVDLADVVELSEDGRSAGGPGQAEASDGPQEGDTPTEPGTWTDEELQAEAEVTEGMGEHRRIPFRITEGPYELYLSDRRDETAEDVIAKELEEFRPGKDPDRAVWCGTKCVAIIGTGPDGRAKVVRVGEAIASREPEPEPTGAQAVAAHRATFRERRPYYATEGDCHVASCHPGQTLDDFLAELAEDFGAAPGSPQTVWAGDGDLVAVVKCRPDGKAEVMRFDAR